MDSLADGAQSIKRAEVNGTVADYLTMLAVSCFADHGGRLAADQHRLAGNKRVMVIEWEPVRVVRDRAEAICYLTIVFADVFQTCKFEGLNFYVIEVDHVDFGLNLRIVNRDWTL